ncbi:MAG: histidine kinase [Bacteroidota bacterium]
MFKANEKYLGFDDRWGMIFIGVPGLTFLIPFLFFGMDWPTFVRVFPQDFLEGLVYTIAFWMTCRYTVIYFRRKYPERKDNLRRVFLQIFWISIFILPLEILITIGCNYVHGNFFQYEIFQPTPLQGTIATYFITFSIISLYEAIYYFKKYSEALLEKEKIQQAHIQGQLDNLRNQINPHFLFNSMNTLMNLIPTDPDRAMNYLTKLSRFYRYTVSKQESTLNDLKSELENSQIYAELLLERFPKSLSFHFPEVYPEQAQILPLCMQILIENAVKHNIVSNKKPLEIHISIVENDTYIQVTNNFQPKIQEVNSTGMGLSNLRQRIAFFTDDPIIVQKERDTFSVAVPLISN